MKKKFALIAAFFFVLFLSSEINVYAGHGEHQRNNCRWYAKRFRANSHLWLACSIPLCYHHGVSCDYADSYCSAAGFGCTATSSSHAGWNGTWGSSNGCGGVCAGRASDLMIEFGEGLGKDSGGEDYYDAIQNTRFTSTFKGNYAFIQGLQLSLTSDVSDPNSNVYTLTVWLPKDDTVRGIEDTVITADKTAQYGSVKILNGRLIITGTLFSSKDFSLTQTGTRVTATYVGGNKSVFVNGLSTVDAVISSEGDVKKEPVISPAKNILANTERKLAEVNASLNVFPNPASDVISIENNIPGFKASIVKIFNLEGRVVSEITINADMQKGTFIKVPIKDLYKGEYLIMATDGKEKYLKKFVKQ
jgi:hypothetical protein